MKLDININRSCKVTLTEAGKAALQEEYPPDYLKHCLPGWDTTGVVTMQLWNYMNVLGPTMMVTTHQLLCDAEDFDIFSQKIPPTVRIQSDCKVTVKLREQGKEILQKRESTRLFPTWDTTGIITMSFWRLCDMFGSALCIGFDVPFDTTVSFEIENGTIS